MLVAVNGAYHRELPMSLVTKLGTGGVQAVRLALYEDSVDIGDITTLST